MGEGNLMGILDRTAGDWPLDLAAEFAGVGLRCAETPEKDGDGKEGEWTAGMVRDLEDLKKGAEERRKMRMGEGHQKEKEENAPSAFICPILQVFILGFRLNLLLFNIKHFFYLLMLHIK